MKAELTGQKRELAQAGSGVKNNDAFAGACVLQLENRNKRSVWAVSTQPCKEAHFATFPPKLIEPCILAGSKKGDVVFDPFMGAGTTAIVAIQHGRNYVGTELSPEYVAIAEKRIASVNTGVPVKEARKGQKGLFT